MNLTKLKTFVTVVETGSYLQAATSLHRSQPAITKAIKSLEEELGLELFDHSSYRAELTAEGEKLYVKSKAIIQQVQHFKNYSNILAGKQENIIQFAIDILYPIKDLAPKLKTFIDEYSETEFCIYSENLNGAMERLMNDEADIAICEQLSDDIAFEAKPIKTVPIIPVATPEYYAANKDNFTSPELLIHTLQIILADSSRTRPKHSVGIVEGANSWTVSNLNTKAELIIAGLGWGRLPEYLIKHELEQGVIIELSEDYIQPKNIKLSLIRKRNTEHGPIAEKIWTAFDGD